MHHVVVVVVISLLPMRPIFAGLSMFGLLKTIIKEKISQKEIKYD